MDSRRLVVSSAASCLFSWRLAVFICVCVWGLPPWLACSCVLQAFWWGIRASRARRVDHNAVVSLLPASAMPEPRRYGRPAAGAVKNCLEPVGR